MWEGGARLGKRAEGGPCYFALAPRPELGGGKRGGALRLARML